MSNKDVVEMGSVIPDFALMKKLQRQMFDLIDEYQAYVLPAAQQSLLDWKDLLYSVERATREAVVEGIALLQGRDFTRFTDDQLRKTRVDAVVVQQQQMLGKLTQQTLRGKQFSLPDLGNLVASLETHASELTGEIERINERLEGLTLSRADLNQVITAFETPSVSKVFKGLIPSAEEIDLALKTVTDPRINADLLKAAARKLESHAEVLEGGRKFNDLLKARSRLDQQIDESRGELARLKRASQMVQNELASNKALAGLKLMKGQWLEQVHKVEQEWYSRSQALGSLKSVEAVIISLEELCDYMLAVERSYENA